MDKIDQAKCGGGSDPNAVVSCFNLWKVFGHRSKEAIQKIRSDSLSKAEIFERTGCTAAVIDVSFTVGRGETFCIMGLSGSGKSTLVRQINRLVEPTDGRIMVDGVNIGEVSDAELRRIRATKIGMVFQHMALFPHLSVWRNVAYGLEVQGHSKTQRQSIAREKLRLVQLADCENRYPGELSGGMQQRVGLARALAADPDILLMDEAFSALDPLIRRQLQDQFLELSRELNKTTIFITHDLEEAMKLGDRIAVMREGRFVQIGTPEELILKPADSYVREFVSGVPRMKILRARSIMRPLSGHEVSEASSRFNGLPKISQDSDLEALAAISAKQHAELVVVDSSGRPVGVVTTQSLLGAICGMNGHEHSTQNLAGNSHG